MVIIAIIHTININYPLVNLDNYGKSPFLMGDKCVKTHLFQAELETDDAWRFSRRRGWRRSRIQPIRIGISSKWRCFVTKQSEQKATNVFHLGLQSLFGAFSLHPCRESDLWWRLKIPPNHMRTCLIINIDKTWWSTIGYHWIFGNFLLFRQTHTLW